MRFNKLIALFSTVLVMLFFYSFVAAAEVSDFDVGQKQTFAKAFSGDDFTLYQTHAAAYEPAPALVRNKFVEDTYKQPKSAAHYSLWNARINYNHCYQLPSRASPVWINNPLRE